MSSNLNFIDSGHQGAGLDQKSNASLSFWISSTTPQGDGLESNPMGFKCKEHSACQTSYHNMVLDRNQLQHQPVLRSAVTSAIIAAGVALLLSFACPGLYVSVRDPTLHQEAWGRAEEL